MVAKIVLILLLVAFCTLALRKRIIDERIRRRDVAGFAWMDKMRSKFAKADTADALLDLRSEIQRDSDKFCNGNVCLTFSALNLLIKIDRKLDNLL